MKTVYNKLVRDRIPKIIAESGHKYKTHTATPEEFKLKLQEKLLEEVNELIENPCAEEMADILEVLEAMRKEYDIDPDHVIFQKESKGVNRGVFYSKTILEWTKGNLERDGDHVHINTGQKKLRKDFKTSGIK